jgi:capsular exopolysaccharide synthesis family protein
MAPPFLKRYLIALNRHKWAGIGGFVFVVGLSGIAAMQPPPSAVYRSEGIMTYAPAPVTLSTTGTELQQLGRFITKEILLSDNVIIMVIEGLAQQEIQLSPEAIRENATVKVNSADDDRKDKENVDVSVSVAYLDKNSDRAQQVADALMQAMVEQSRELNRQQLSIIANELNLLLPSVTYELRQAEQNLERYIRQEGPDITVAQSGALVGAITNGQAQRRQLQFTLAGIEAQIRSLESRLGLSADEAYASSALSADPIIADLRSRIHQSETQIAVLSQTLRPEHPSIIELRSQQQSFEQLLQQRVDEVIGGNQVTAPIQSSDQIRQASSLDPARQQLASSLVNLQTQSETLQQQLATLSATEQQLRQEYSRLPNKQLEQARLEQQVALKRAFYDQLQAKLADVTLAQSEAVGKLAIAQQAGAAQLASGEARSPILLLLIGSLVGLLVGGGLVVLLSSLDATFHTLQDLQVALRQQEVPVLGLLPLMSSGGTQQPIAGEPNSPYMEFYERLRGSLRRLATDKPLKLVLLTSTVEDEGKTVTAYNLAIASAAAGKRTLLIEADLRSPSQAPLLKVNPDPESLVEPLRYYGQISECIRLVPEIENLFILPSPGPQRHAAAILESSEMRRLLDDARGRFDLVLLDTPALSQYSDALLIEPLTDGLILVTRPGYTEEGMLNEAIEQFMESEDIQFLGAVINGADIPVRVQDLEIEMGYDSAVGSSNSSARSPGMIQPLEQVGANARETNSTN